MIYTGIPFKIFKRSISRFRQQASDHLSHLPRGSLRVGLHWRERHAGNGLANRITGNNAANALNGGLGNDTLIGGAGNDYLVGSGGADLLIGDDPNSINGPGGDDDFMLLDGDITAIGGGGEDSFTINNRVGAPSDRTLHISGNQVDYGGEDGGLGLAESEDRLSVGWHTPESDPIASLLTITGNEQGILNYNGRTVEFHEIERVDLYDGDDRVVVEKGSTMTVFGGRGDDTLVLPDPVGPTNATRSAPSKLILILLTLSNSTAFNAPI